MSYSFLSHMLFNVAVSSVVTVVFGRMWCTSSSKGWVIRCLPRYKVFEVFIIGQDYFFSLYIDFLGLIHLPSPFTVLLHSWVVLLAHLSDPLVLTIVVYALFAVLWCICALAFLFHSPSKQV